MPARGTPTPTLGTLHTGGERYLEDRVNVQIANMLNTVRHLGLAKR